ncbi:LysR family transcriptional regulator [Vibrio superstes]|uniref:LysR family transcriptional regulator n=1 Tax=Vibrio superstes NBRC 103154 TaxID=1219062 RepID=A0A511QPG2_9VIBR|nr:LysR family transcriptional regulator [Vibrio superstes]GEM79017.1 LysR family transcriptional regulator [Vibrio superstes NBRC 103154]
MDLNSLKTFTEVVVQGSFSAASKSLAMPVSTVSRKISELEEALGQRLMERSTRSLRLTEAGETLYQYAQRSVEEMEAGISALQKQQDQVEGTLRVALPPNFEVTWEAIKAFTDKYPKVKLQLLGITRDIDPISDNIDIVIQYNASQNPSLISRKLATISPILVASRRYVELHGKPNAIADLNNFQCLARGNPGDESFWTMDNEKVYFEAAISSNEFRFLRFLVGQDCGIAQLPPFFCKREIDNDEFVEILPECSSPIVDIHLIYTSRKHLSRVVRAFIDHSIEFSQNEQSEYWQS